MFHLLSKGYNRIIFFLCLLNIIGRLPLINHPAFWDEVNYLNGALVIAGNKLNPFIEFWGYKPPLMFEPVALLFLVGSKSMIWARLFIYFTSSLSLLFCYLLGKTVFNKEVGLVSTILLFTFPLFTAQSFLYLDAIPLTALCLATLYFYFSKKRYHFTISAILLCLTKETAVFIPFILGIYEFYLLSQHTKITKQILFERLPKFIIPILTLMIWLFINKMFFNWFLWPYNLNYFSVSNIFEHLYGTIFLSYFNKVFMSQSLWVIFFLLIVGLIHTLKSGVPLRRELILFSVLFAFYFVLYSVATLLQRYMLFLYPLVFIFFASLLSTVYRKIQTTLVVLIVVLFIFNTFSFRSTLFTTNEDRNMGFIKNIDYQRRLSSYLEQHYPDYTVTTAWPLSEYYAKSFFGYVLHENNTEYINCQTGIAEKKSDTLKRIYINSNMNCIPYIHTISDTMVKRFEFDDYSYAEIYLTDK